MGWIGQSNIRNKLQISLTSANSIQLVYDRCPHWLKKIYVDSLVHDDDALKLLIKKVGVQRIALGTDYPYPLGELQPGALIEKMIHLTQDQRAWLNYKSALSFLGIDEKKFF